MYFILILDKDVIKKDIMQICEDSLSSYLAKIFYDMINEIPLTIFNYYTTTPM